MCPNCGNPVQPGTTVCPYCNHQLQQPMNQPMNQPMGQPMQQPMNQPMQPPMQQPMNQPMGQPMQQPMGQPMGGPMPVYNQPPEKKSNIGKIILFIILGIVAIVVILMIIGSLGSKKLTCEKGSEKVTIRYTEKKVVGCIHIGGNGKCDLDELNKYVDTYGMNETISSLETEFKNAGYTCSK